MYNRAPGIRMNIAVFESRHQPLLPRAEFLRRQARYAALALAIVFGSLLR